MDDISYKKPKGKTKMKKPKKYIIIWDEYYGSEIKIVNENELCEIETTFPEKLLKSLNIYNIDIDRGEMKLYPKHTNKNKKIDNEYSKETINFKRIVSVLENLIDMETWSNEIIDPSSPIGEAYKLINDIKNYCLNTYNEII